MKMPYLNKSERDILKAFRNKKIKSNIIIDRYELAKAIRNLKKAVEQEIKPIFNFLTSKQ
jgi:hypothetical protein